MKRNIVNCDAQFNIQYSVKEAGIKGVEYVYAGGITPCQCVVQAIFLLKFLENLLLVKYEPIINS